MSPPGRTHAGWRWGTPVILVLSGGLFVASALSSDGTDLRPGRYTDLASLVRAESVQAEELTARVTELNDEVAALSGGLGDAEVDGKQAEVDVLRDPAGLTEVSGDALTITLSDSPDDVRQSSSRNPNLYVVHQQDIQAVVNAMWSGGAEAVMIQGQRIVSTTGIKCEGNAILLQGIPYPQPYEITAVGDVDELRDAVDSDRDVSIYRGQAGDPEIAIGWEVDEEDDVVAPAYRGLLDLEYATPIA